MPRSDYPKNYQGFAGVAIAQTDSAKLRQRLTRDCEPTASGCWEWQAYTDRDGYGELKHQGRKRRAHRMAYAAFVGEVLDGMDIDHTCRNRACINPEHLRQMDPLTNRVIMRDERRYGGGAGQDKAAEQVDTGDARCA